MEKIEKLEKIEDQISQNLVRCKSEKKDLEKDDYMWDSMSVDAIKKHTNTSQVWQNIKHNLLL
jgi:hypothetical protein